MDADAVVDAKGMRCPRPIVEMAKRVRQMASGQVVEVWATDPVARNDIPAWCRKTGNEFLGREDRDGYISFFVRKAT